MTEDDARRVMLVRAIEQEDGAGDLLTKQDRAQAHEVGRAALTGSGRKSDDLFLARRAEFLAGRLASRQPLVNKVLRFTAWPAWLSWAVPLIAFAAGLLLNELGNGSRLNLLAFPLVGMLAWNALVYLWLLVNPLVALMSGERTTGLPRLLAKFARLGQRGFDRATPIARAMGDFSARWSGASSSLALARGSRTLHLGAALFALGVIAGVYFRALGIEYRAGWESTFLGAATVHTLLATMLGPASAVSGVPIPGPGQIEAIRWTGANSGGMNAAPWIHLFMLTVVGFVVLPRLVLAGLSALNAWRKRQRFALPGRGDFYYRRLLRGAHGRPGSVRVTPYAYHPDEKVRAGMQGLVQDALGDGTVLKFDPPVEYGGEDAWLAGLECDASDDHHLLLFTASATPEHENHGVLAQRLREQLASCAEGTMAGAVVDESAFRARFAGQSALAQRAVTRAEGWQTVMGRAGLRPLVIDLTAETEAAAKAFEALMTGEKLPVGGAA